MQIQETEISCGVQQLVEIGENPTLEQYKDALADGMGENSHDGLGCFLVASVPWDWRRSLKFLKSVGFKRHGVRKNPNSGNKIVLLSKTLTAKERQTLMGNRCRDCSDLIPKGRRVCDFCKTDKSYYSRW